MAEKYCRKCHSRLVECPTCKGKGLIYDGSFIGGGWKRCKNCNGTGWLCPRHGPDHG